jgi:hypothetical protein
MNNSYRFYNRATGKTSVLTIKDIEKRLCVSESRYTIFTTGERCYPATDAAISEVRNAATPWPEPWLYGYTDINGVYVKLRRVYVVLGWTVWVVEPYVSNLGLLYDGAKNPLSVEGDGLAMPVNLDGLTLLIGTGYVLKTVQGIHVKYIAPPADGARLAFAAEAALKAGIISAEDAAAVKKLVTTYLSELEDLKIQLQQLRDLIRAGKKE